MGKSYKLEPFILLVGDIIIFLFSLWTALFVRYFSVPSYEVFMAHILPFSIIFIVWVLVFYIGGLYEKHTLILKSRLPSLLLNIQALNTGIAIAFFYLIPYFNIAPKTNLFLYLVISFPLFLFWRVYGVPHIGFRKKEKAILVGAGEEMKELFYEVNNNPRYNLYFISSVDLNKIDSLDFEEEILNRVYSENVSIVVMDIKNDKVIPILPRLYNLIFYHVRFIDKYKIYEDIFDRVPLSLIGYNWFLENISSASHISYDILKRAMDIIISSVLILVSLVFYPFVWLAIKLSDSGRMFFIQERVGKNNKPIKIIKFRSMTEDKSGDITKVGQFLRKSRLDEIPQLWNVLRGDLSLVGPRPELPDLVKHYEEEIPYYDIRHLIKPGLSGWAQIYHENHPHHKADVSETKMKLSYDLYYLKNRSLLLDLKIALKTLKILLSAAGK